MGCFAPPSQHDSLLCLLSADVRSSDDAIAVERYPGSSESAGRVTAKPAVKTTKKKPAKKKKPGKAAAKETLNRQTGAKDSEQDAMFATDVSLEDEFDLLNEEELTSAQLENFHDDTALSEYVQTMLHLYLHLHLHLHLHLYRYRHLHLHHVCICTPLENLHDGTVLSEYVQPSIKRAWCTGPCNCHSIVALLCVPLT